MPLLTPDCRLWRLTLGFIAWKIHVSLKALHLGKMGHMKNLGKTGHPDNIPDGNREKIDI